MSVATRNRTAGKLETRIEIKPTAYVDPGVTWEYEIKIAGAILTYASGYGSTEYEARTEAFRRTNVMLRIELGEDPDAVQKAVKQQIRDAM